MRLTWLLNLLIVFSLLLPAAPAQAAPPASIIQEQVVETTPTPIVTPTPTGSLEPAPYPTPFPTSEPIAYPTPLPASEPTGSPTPIASPESTAIPSAEPPTPSPTPEAISPAQLALLLSAPSSALIPGESVVLSWQVLDWRESQADLRLELNLPQAFTPGDGPAQIYDPQTGKLELPVHAAQGQLFLHSQADATGSFTIQASLRQGQAVIDHANYTYQEEGLNQVGRGGGQARGLNGKVTVDFPAEAAGEDLEVRVRRPAPSRRPPHSLSGSPFEILASGKTSGQEHHRFQAPLTVTIDYDPAQFPGPESSLRLAYYDPEQAAWLPVESRVDLANHRLSAALDHLSVFDVSAGGWESARLPGMEGFQVAHFTGAASYSLPFWTPPGPGGLQPSLSLTYNSQVVDNARARYTQAGWVGMGWSLETGAIERDQHGTDGVGDDTFTLTAGGISSRLVLSADGYYHTVDESFWRIRYNSAQDSWTAWDGTGNQFIFGESDNARATYPLGMIDCAQANQNLTWRWSLSRQVNAYGKALSYTYTEEDQGKTSACDPDVQYPATLASYPASIQYPDSPYRIVFDLAVRNDYRPGWSSSGALTFYQRSRLQQIRIMDGSAELRRYVFSYAAADPIYPNINWDGNSKTLTLSAVQEFGLNNTALPATTFSYTDGLHLTAASNGYGGSAAYQYEGVPWHDLNKNERKSHTDEIGCEYDNQAEEWQPSNIFGYNGGSTWCETNAQGGNPQLYVNGSAYLDLPPALLQPAAIYTTLFSAYNKDLWDRPITVKVGLISGVGEHIAQEIANVADHTTVSLEAPVRLPGTASTVRLYLYCSGKCTVLSAKVYLMSTRYRVEGQTLGDSTTNAVRPTTFRYDEAALNDAAHSARAASGGTLYTPPNSQFRGHAMSMALGADGQAATAFYHQDDARKGQVSLSIVTKEDYYAGFDNGGYDPLQWTVYNSAGLSVNRLLGDPALQVSAGSVWDGVNRSGYSLSDGEIALASSGWTARQSRLSPRWKAANQEPAATGDGGCSAAGMAGCMPSTTMAWRFTPRASCSTPATHKSSSRGAAGMA